MKENCETLSRVALDRTQTYLKIEWLTNCVIKRLAKGQPVTAEHLANCSTMRAIILEAQKLDEPHTNEQKKLARMVLAKYIIDTAEYVMRPD